jgi:zinc protease
MRRIVSSLLLFVALILPNVVQAMNVERVTSPGGVEAWLVRDKLVPVVALQFSFRGGTSSDPAGKEGLANLVATLLDEGAGDLDSQAFQRRIEDNAIGLSFAAGRDHFGGSLKTIAARQDIAFDLLALALQQPRFDEEAVTRMRSSVKARIRANQSDPDWLASRTFNGIVFSGHPYALPGQGTLASVEAITIEDLKRTVRENFTRDRLLVTVTGDIEPQVLAAALDRIFAGLPAVGRSLSLPEAELQARGQTVLLPWDGPQTVVQLADTGLKRDDADYYAATVLNYVLGGGGFSSRLMNEVREKRGLVYGVSTGIASLEHGALMQLRAATSNEKVGEALDLIRAEWAKMRESGITEEELRDAQTYLTGSLPLSLSSTDRIAGLLLGLRQDNLPPDYLDRYVERINAVTREDVLRVAQRLLNPDRLSVILVGQPQGVTPTRTLETAPGAS